MFVSVAIFSGCKEEPTATPAESFDITAEPKFSATIDGSSVTFTNNTSLISISNAAIVGNGSGGNGGSSFKFGCDFSNTQGTQAFNITKGTILVPWGGNYEQDQFETFFKAETVPYTVNRQGMELSYLSKGVVYRSDLGDQTGSSFVLQAVDYKEVEGEYNVKFAATFNCTLYDEDGNSIEVTNGKAVGYFGE